MITFVVNILHPFSLWIQFHTNLRPSKEYQWVENSLSSPFFPFPTLTKTTNLYSCIKLYEERCYQEGNISLSYESLQDMRKKSHESVQLLLIIWLNKEEKNEIFLWVILKKQNIQILMIVHQGQVVGTLNPTSTSVHQGSHRKKLHTVIVPAWIWTL